jgi:osomolarity two-component system sensor histidine kinase NIK1
VRKAVARGDLSETIDVEASGEIAELKTTVNGMVRLKVHLGGGEL